MSTFEKRPPPEADLKTGTSKITPTPKDHPPAQAGGSPVLGQGGGSVGALQSVFGALFADAGTQAKQPTQQTVTPSQPPPALTPQCPAPERTPAQQKQIDSALAVAQDKLSYGVLDWKITDADARTALGALRGLPQDLRAVALDKLDPTSFSRLLKEVPESDRTQFKDLITSCADPARKLQLFGVYHQANAKQDAVLRDDADPTNEQAKKQRAAIVKETESEIATEVPFLLKQVQEGKLTTQQLDEYMARKESEHSTEMQSLVNQTGTLDGLPNEQRLQYVKEQTDSLLSRSLTDWKITDAEARKSLKLLTGLPPELQNQAVKQMSPESFWRLLRELPDEDRTQLKPLLDNCDDPALKVQLFGVYHKGRIRDDAAKEKQKTADEGKRSNRSAEQIENQRLNTRRDEIISKTDEEMDEEVQFLLTKQESGKAITMKDFDDLVKRKEHEHRIEMKYNVNLTNDEGARTTESRGTIRDANGNVTGPGVTFQQGSKIVWEDSELEQLESGLARMPADHVRGNAMLKNIHRSAVRTDKGVTKPTIGGDHSDGRIRMFDSGVTERYRNTDDPREQQDPKLNSLGGPRISSLEEVTIHEFGHDLHDTLAGQGDAFTRYQKAAGWREGLSVEDLLKANLTPTQIQTLQQQPGYQKPGGNGITAQDGQTYISETGSDGTIRYRSYDDGRIPSGASWGYARFNPRDHFAEHYMKASLKPETLAKDMLDTPKQRLESAETNVQLAKDKLKKLRGAGASEQEKQAQEQEVQRLTGLAEEAWRDKEAQQKQFSIMRNEVFHSDQATSSAEDRLRKKGLTEEQITSFRKQAERYSTPQQIEQLEQGFSP